MSQRRGIIRRREHVDHDVRRDHLVLDSNVIEWGLFPVAIFFNMPPGDAGTYSITVTHPDRECTVQDPEPPTMARHINLIYVDCL